MPRSLSSAAGSSAKNCQRLAFIVAAFQPAPGTPFASAMLLGGEAFSTQRHVFWNFVSSSRDRINQAKEDWKARRFPLVPGDEEEFIPLPEIPLTVTYP